MQVTEILKPDQPTAAKEHSAAALRVLAAREQLGNDSDYDKFLCWRSGDVAPLSPHFPPIDRVAPSGRVYTYNNPHLVRNSFSREGLMINYRQASQPVVPGEETFGFCVATLDLRTEQMTDWQITSVAQSGTPDRRITRLGLVRPQAVSVVGGAGAARSIGATEVLADAWFVMDPQGSYFVADGRWELLEPMDRLVAEVNELTEGRGLRLDEIRQQAAAAFGQAVTPLQLSA